MHPILRKQAVVVLALATFVVVNHAAATAQTILKQDGLMTAACETLRIFGLATDGERLAVKIETNFQSANQMVRKLSRSAGSRGSSSSQGGNGWRMLAYFTRGTASIRYGQHFGRVSGRPDLSLPKYECEVREYFEPNRELTIRAEESGVFFIEYQEPKKEYLFRLRQESNNRVGCVELTKKGAFVSNASSFDELCRKEQAFVNERLIPILGRLGLGKPVTRFDPIVIESVLRQLVPEDEQKAREFRDLVDELDGRDFETRQLATATVREQFDEWKSYIEKAILDESFSVEIRSRLKKVLESKVTAEELSKTKLVSSAGLTSDAHYLWWIWKTYGSDSAENDQQEFPVGWESVIADQLRSLTGKQIGSSTADWDREFKDSFINDATNDGNTKSTPLQSRLFDALGPLEANANVIAQIIGFRQIGDELALDTERWREPFGGKSIAESNQEIQEILKDRNLPIDWFRPGGNYTIESTNFPQVLFKKFETVAGNPNRPSVLNRNQAPSTPLHTLNRQMESDSAFARMEFHPPSELEFNRHRRVARPVGVPLKGNSKLTPEYFQFVFREKVAPYRSLRVRTKPSGHLMVSLVSNELDCVARILQVSKESPFKSGNRIRLELLNVDSVEVAEATDFAELLNDHRSLVLQGFVPLLEQLGIAFPVDAGSELN